MNTTSGKREAHEENVLLSEGTSNSARDALPFSRNAYVRIVTPGFCTLEWHRTGSIIIPSAKLHAFLTPGFFSLVVEKTTECNAKQC